MKNSKNLSLFGRMGKLQRLFLIALFSVLAIGAYAQSKTVSGTVIDQTGEPVIGANVIVKGTTNGIPPFYYTILIGCRSTPLLLVIHKTNL